MSSESPVSTWITLLEKKKQELSKLKTQNAPVSDEKEFKVLLGSFLGAEFPEGRLDVKIKAEMEAEMAKRGRDAILDKKALRSKIAGRVMAAEQAKGGQEAEIARRELLSKMEKASLESNIAEPRTHIIDLTKKVASLPGWGVYPKNTPESQIWQVSSLLLERARESGIKAKDLAELMKDFGARVPHVPKMDFWDMSQYGNQHYIQEPLQEIFSLYIEFHLLVVHQLGRDPKERSGSLASDPDIQDLISRIANQMEKAGVKYEKAEDIALEPKSHKGLHAHRRTPNFPPHLTENGKFEVVRHLGIGAYAAVDEVREIATGKSYARKRLHGDPHRTLGVTWETFQKEIGILQKLRHDHIIAVVDGFKDDMNSFSFIMQPVANCDLGDYLQKTDTAKFPLTQIEKMYPWFGCLLDALDYLHRKDIKHRDIKPSNILVYDDNAILTDFGLAKDFSESGLSISSGPEVGNPIYRAPTTITGRAADIFALGCVYAEMLTITRGKSNETFREFRCNTERDESDQYTYRYCLPKVIEWIKDCAAAGKDGVTDILIDLVQGMMEKKTPENSLEGTCSDHMKKLHDRKFWCNLHYRS